MTTAHNVCRATVAPAKPQGFASFFVKPALSDGGQATELMTCDIFYVGHSDLL
jgi:hypothetical protein